MAYAQIDYQFPDGTRVSVIMGTDQQDRAYPDQLHELAARVLELHRQVVVDAEPEAGPS